MILRHQRLNLGLELGQPFWGIILLLVGRKSGQDRILDTLHQKSWLHWPLCVACKDPMGRQQSMDQRLSSQPPAEHKVSVLTEPTEETKLASRSQPACVWKQPPHHVPYEISSGEVRQQTARSTSNHVLELTELVGEPSHATPPA